MRTSQNPTLPEDNHKRCARAVPKVCSPLIHPRTWIPTFVGMTGQRLCLKLLHQKVTTLKPVIPTQVGIQVALLAGMKAFLEVTLNETASAYQVTQPQPTTTLDTPDTHAADPIIQMGSA